MSAQQKAPRSRQAATESAVNEVRLVGRVSQAPEERVLPSGDVLWTFRVVVARPAAGGRRTVDALDCSAWSSRVQRSVASWSPDDVVEVTGAMRRRFFRTAAGAASRVEIEVSRGKVIRRAGSG
ncbi:single-stranded DNA-binding protein [Nocardioides sp. YIM 152315]|uniref:single-stranded DNA-binding protein n=1 Tax=Nocardioides sp. YIM 152315 TaxID=3031760 RepID=UPI0023DABEB7|nr:single-stranded DNA-binding protein [Nocardioides sp. YIM 152315]MDF1606519.1 single-stranded DNA-binding protein [Nocardioides sp. YIM 152315]